MKKMTVTAVLTAMMGVASAQVYVGGVVGQARANLDCADFDLGCDKTDTGLKVLVGHKFNPVLAIEAAYVDFGKASGAFTLSGQRVNAHYEAHGALLAAVIRHAAHPQLSLVGRVGASYLKTKGVGVVPSIDRRVTLTDSSVKPYLGIGLEFSLNKNLRLTADADFTSAELEGDTGALRMLGLGVQYAY